MFVVLGKYFDPLNKKGLNKNMKIP